MRAALYFLDQEVISFTSSLQFDASAAGPAASSRALAAQLKKLCETTSISIRPPSCLSFVMVARFPSFACRRSRTFRSSELSDAPSISVILVPRVTGTDGTGVRVHVAGGAVIVALGVVRIGGHMGLHVGAAVRSVALDAVALRVRTVSAPISAVRTVEAA